MPMRALDDQQTSLPSFEFLLKSNAIPLPSRRVRTRAMSFARSPCANGLAAGAALQWPSEASDTLQLAYSMAVAQLISLKLKS